MGAARLPACPPALLGPEQAQAPAPRARSAGGSTRRAGHAPPARALQVVRSTDDEAPSVTVNVDTLTFDRVLIYLEAAALGRQLPSYAVHLLPDLLQVGGWVG
jgi:hypothetical protein